MKLEGTQRKSFRNLNSLLCASQVSLSDLTQDQKNLLLDGYKQVLVSYATLLTRNAVINRQAHKCFYCNENFDSNNTMKRATLDHVIAKSTAKDLYAFAMLNLPSNLIACCTSCNSAKGTLTLLEWHSRMIAKGLTQESFDQMITRLNAILRQQIAFKQIDLQKVLGVNQ